ncbi:RNA lariat debranching enzyme [Babesia gibsoni]|uniref:RNA lariat debranching enzyme n=1 Tax=Babesia gibsoni TaxID=33632 RepID=A0AAD8LK43_BABGI|nr:RNA lariat debranching enzyme [Babesia gibsoni]
MNIAIEGCSHGELDLIYEHIKRRQLEHNIKVDLLICCGDFQAIRDEFDLEEFCCPPKYKHYRDFKDYYHGIKEAPLLTVFVGGNHEAPSLLKELYFGGWVAKNIYYLGHSGVISVNGIRIAGVSGIYDHRDYPRGFFEARPYDESTKRSAYHVREFDIKKLELLKEPIDMFVSHDWPRGIEQWGDVEGLLRHKPHLRHDVEANRLGNPYTWMLLRKHKPRYWFAAHMHTRFEARVKHDEGETYFLALDKPIGRRSFLEFMQLEPSVPTSYFSKNSVDLFYDIEWLSILKANSHKMPMNAFSSAVELSLIEPNEEVKKQVLRALQDNSLERVMVNGKEMYKIKPPTENCIKNPKDQREMFMAMLKLEDNNYFKPNLQARLQVSFIPD